MVAKKGRNEDGSENVEWSDVPSEMFDLDKVTRLGVSGGTAPFFSLTLSESAAANQKKSPTHYLGKDLSHAMDEVQFYEYLLKHFSVGRDKEDAAADDGDREVNKQFQDVFQFAFEYIGVLKAKPVDEDEELSLLVIRNLRDGKARLRLLDLKIGRLTAQAGWKGKGTTNAFSNNTVDAITNSSQEGYRLEGFDGLPAALESHEPLMDLSVTDQKIKKKARKVFFQTMSGEEIFKNLIDLRDLVSIEDNVFSSSSIKNVFSSTYEYFTRPETAEIVLHEVLIRLLQLSVACSKLSIPQKWIGSSVGIGFDCSTLPVRAPTGGERPLRESVVVNIFDWGRSELNTKETYQQMTAEEKRDRTVFWQNYRDAIYNLSWSAAKVYRSIYGVSTEWKSIEVELFDFDALSAHDSIGRVTIPLKVTDKGKIERIKIPVSFIDSLTHKCYLYYTVKWISTIGKATTEKSRLQGYWNVYIEKAVDVPNKDGFGGISDPFCALTAKSVDGKFQYTQYTSVKENEANPVWKETLDFPVMRHPDTYFKDAFDKAGLNDTSCGIDDVDRMLHIEIPSHTGHFLQQVHRTFSNQSPAERGKFEWNRIFERTI